MSEGSLVVLKKNGSEGSKYPMEKENKYILGPGADCHLRFNVENYNQNICEISTNKKLATITKLSSCPILLNNNEIKTPKSLKYGDVIKIGPKTFKWSSLIRRESFTRNVFKNSSKSSASKSKRRSSLSDFHRSNKLNTWRETDENVQVTSSEHPNVIKMSSSSTKSTKMKPKSSEKSKTVPKNYGTLNKTPRALAVVKSLDFRTRSTGKKISPAKKKYFDPNNKTSKIPRIFFPDNTKVPKLSKTTNKSPKTKTFEEFKENFKTPTPEPENRKSTRISLELNSNAQIALTEANVRTPDSLGVKPETPNIKLVKSVNKKSASLKKSLDNITMAKKRKISNVISEDSFVSKKFKLDENEVSLIQDETMGSLFDSSLSFLESSISSRRSNRNSLPIASSPISPKHNISGIKSLSTNIKSPVNFISTGKLSLKARQSLQLNSPKNEVVKRRFTESNLNSSQIRENEIRIIKPIFSTPKAQSSTIDLTFETPIEEKVRKSVGRPEKNPKISSLIKETKVKRSPGRPRMSGIKTVLKSPKNISNLSGRKSVLRTPGSSLSSPINKSIKKLIVKSTPGKQSPGRPRKSKIETVLKSPKNSVLNVSRRKSMLSTPGSPLTSPKNKSIQEIIVKSTPGKQSPGRPRKSETVLQSPKNSVLNVSGRKSMLSTPGSPLMSPKNKSIQEIIVKSTPGKQSPGRPRKSETDLQSPKNSVLNVSGRKSILSTSGSPLTSPKNKSIQEIIVKSTPGKQSPGRPRKSVTVLQSPKNSILNVSGRKSRLSTPGSPLTSPKNKSIQEIIVKSTPGKQSPGRPRKSETVLQSPKNSVLNVSGRKSMLSTPGSPLTSPKNKSIQEIIVKSTPGKQSPGRPRKSEIVLQSPKNSVLNVSGRKSMLSTPGSPLMSPKNKSIQEIIVKSTPGKQSPGRPRKSETVLQSPKNSVLNVSGRKSMLSTSGSPLMSPKNKSIQEIIVKSTPGKQSPGRPRKSETVLQSPKNSVLHVSGRKSMLSTPGSPLTSPKNKSIQEIIVKSTPGKQSPGRPRKSEIVLQSPKNSVLNVSGRKSMLSTPGSPLMSPKNKSIQEIIVKSTPGKQSPGRPRKSETVLQSPKNSVLNVSGRKSMLSTSGSPLMSPKNKSIQEIIVKSTPGKQSPGRPRKSETVLQSPKNSVLHVSGRKSMLSTPGSPLTSPKNKSIQEIIAKSTPGKQSPGRPRKSKIKTVLQSPKNSVLNVSGRKSMLSTPGSPLMSPKNKSIQEIIVKSTPGKQSPGRPRKSETVLQSPKNSVLNISGRKSMLSTPGSPLMSPKNKSIQEIIVKSTPGKQSPGRPRKSETVLQSLKNSVLNISGRKSMLSTPGSPLTSPKNKSIKKIIVRRTPGRSKTPKRNPGRTPKSPKNDLTNVAGVKKLLKTPGRPPKSPKNDLTNISGVKKLLATPSHPPKSPKNDLTNVAGVKKLLKTPGRKPKSPKNDLTNIAGVKKLLGTPGRPPKSPKNDLTNIAGVKKLLKTPGRKPKSPKNDLTNIPGVKQLLRTPGRPPKSPKNDLNDIYGVKNLFRSPGRPRKSPKNDLTNVRGVKNLWKSPGRRQKSPKNDLSNLSGVKNLLRSPGRPPKSPKNELSNISGIKLMFASPEIQNSPRYELKNNSPLISIMKTPKNKLSNVSGIKSIVSTPQNKSANLYKTPERKLKTPRKQNQPKNDLSDVEGVASLFNTSKLNSPTNNMDSVFDHLKDENNDTLNLSFTINSKSPLRTYERKVKSLSPEKPKLFEPRKSLREIPEDSKKKESVQKWLNEYVLNKEKSSTPSSPTTRSRRLKKVENEENIAPNKILTPKNKNLNLETNNLTPSSPTTRSRRLKKVENEENIATEQEKIVSQSPIPTKTRRTRKNVEETKAPTPKVTRRGRNAAKTTEDIIEIAPIGRTTRKRTKKEDLTTENVETTEPVAAKRPRKNVQFDVLENEEKEEIPKTKRGGSRKKLKEETEEITSPVKQARTRGRKAQKTEEIETAEKPLEKKTTTRSRRGKKIEEIKDDSVVEEITKEPAKKPTRNVRSKKNEEPIEETKEVPTKRSTRKKIAENEEPPLENETKTTTRRAGRQKKEVEPETELKETRPTRGRKPKNETKEDEIKEPEVKTRSTRGKKKIDEETVEPVRKITRSRRN